jgi:predicted small lipoprotein YifL
MRLILALAAAAAAGCGQTGSLYLPDKEVETPVEIRAPVSPSPATVPQADPEIEDEEEKATQPPGR